MEAVFIENYRGKDIFYSTRNEKFYADIDEGKEKNLIHLVRKDIDDYIKANMSFNPFECFDITSFGNNFRGPKIRTVIGIRKDKGLQCKDNEQISNYELKDEGNYDSCNWFVLNVEAKETCLINFSKEEEQIKKLKEKIKFHEANIKGFVNEMKGENLADFRRRILGETKEEIN